MVRSLSWETNPCMHGKQTLNKYDDVDDRVTTRSKTIADLVISSRRDLVSGSFKNVYFLLLLLLLLKVDDVTI